MHRSNSKRLSVAHLKYVALMLAIFVVYILAGTGCPIHRLGYRCPTCGVTRALRSLLLGNLEQYFALNPFALPLIIAVVIGVHLSAMPVKWRRCGTLYVVIATASNLCWYVYGFV